MARKNSALIFYMQNVKPNMCSQNTYGICFVSGVPPTAEATEELSRRLGIIRETQCSLNSNNHIYLYDNNYLCIHKDGGFWDFTSDLAKGDTAYTNMALRAHTDTTYFVRITKS